MDQSPCTSILYSQASPTLRTQALLVIQQYFYPLFVELTPAQWEKAMEACYPTLIVNEASVEVDDDELTRLATYLRNHYLEYPNLHQLGYCTTSRHVAYKLIGFCRRAALALAQADALPPEERHEAELLYQRALQSMSSGDAVAERIMDAFNFKRVSTTPTPKKRFFTEQGGQTMIG